MEAGAGETSGILALIGGGYSWAAIVDAVGTEAGASDAAIAAGTRVESLLASGAPLSPLIRPAVERGGARIHELLVAGASIPRCA
jgi:hypothetical protein